MPHQDEGAREMKHAQEIVEPVFPPDCKAAVILKPRKQAFDLPPATEAAESAAILRAILAIASAVPRPRSALPMVRGQAFACFFSN